QRGLGRDHAEIDGAVLGELAAERAERGALGGDDEDVSRESFGGHPVLQPSRGVSLGEFVVGIGDASDEGSRRTAWTVVQAMTRWRRRPGWEWPKSWIFLTV